LTLKRCSLVDQKWQGIPRTPTPILRLHILATVHHKSGHNTMDTNNCHGDHWEAGGMELAQFAVLHQNSCINSEPELYPLCFRVTITTRINRHGYAQGRNAICSWVHSRTLTNIKSSLSAIVVISQSRRAGPAHTRGHDQPPGMMGVPNACCCFDATKEKFCPLVSNTTIMSRN